MNKDMGKAGGLKAEIPNNMDLYRYRACKHIPFSCPTSTLDSHILSLQFLLIFVSLTTQCPPWLPPPSRPSDSIFSHENSDYSRPPLTMRIIVNILYCMAGTVLISNPPNPVTGIDAILSPISHIGKS